MSVSERLCGLLRRGRLLTLAVLCRAAVRLCVGGLEHDRIRLCEDLPSGYSCPQPSPWPAILTDGGMHSLRPAEPTFLSEWKLPNRPLASAFLRTPNRPAPRRPKSKKERWRPAGTT